MNRPQPCFRLVEPGGCWDFDCFSNSRPLPLPSLVMPGLRLTIWLLLASPCAISALWAAEDTNAPTQLRGVVTFSDAARKLIVLQDGDRVNALHSDLANQGLHVGERVVLEGTTAPLITACPNFPDRPDGSTVRGLFEAPTNWNDFFLSRLSGVLHPPTSGNYTFWVASDDSSELWLSDNADRLKARRIALVPSGRWTEPRQWTRLPSQQSAPIRLEAGKSYYIEALAQDTSNRDCLAVAWQGPGFSQTIIGGKHVTPGPVVDGKAASGPTNGTLWEYWTNFFSTDFSVLRTTNNSVAKLTQARILKRESGALPAAMRIQEGQPLDVQADFRWVDLEGRVNFISKKDDGRLMELRCGRAKILVHVQGANDIGSVIPNESLVRVTGFFEPAHNLDRSVHSGTLWVNSAQEVGWFERPENWALVEELPQHRLNTANPELSAGRLVRAQGRVVAQEAADLWRLDGKDTIQGYVSADGTNWSLAGPTVEVHLSPDALVGFALSSHRTNELATVDFDNVSGIELKLSGANVGNPPIAGDFTKADGSLRLKGSGDDIWHQSDQFFFTYQKIGGDFQIRARLTKFAESDFGAKSVLMVRESLSPTSPWAGVTLMPGERVGVQARVEPAGSAAGALAVMSLPEKWIKLVRHRNSFLVRASADALKPGEMFEVLGEVGWLGQSVVLEQSRIREWPAPADNAVVPPVEPPVGEYREVAIAEIGAEAKRAVRDARLATFKIRGVVTFNGPLGNDWLSFVQDQSGATLIQWKVRPLATPLRVGDLVELMGSPILSESGAEFSAHGVTRLGVSEMPAPIRPRSELPKAGASDGRWVEIEGVGRTSGADGKLLLMSRAGPLEVYAGTLAQSELTNWVNALVRVRGVLWRQPNPLLLLPVEQCVQIIERSPDDPFGIPLFPIQKLQKLDGELKLARRLKVAGTITCRRDGFLVLQDQTGGIWMEGKVGFDTKVGDKVEVIGFPAERGIGVVLTEIVVRPAGQNQPVPPMELEPENVIHVQNNGKLVSVEVVLLAQHPGGDMQTLDVQSGQRAFQASLPNTGSKMPSLAVGSRLRLTGVAMVNGAATSIPDQAADKALAGSLELLLRDPADVVVIERPPWWNWKYTAATCGLGAVIFVGAVIWIRTLRKRVEERTHELRETMGKLQKETQISATLAERDRLAAEIHDSVEQGLSAIMMQMEAATMVDDLQEVKRHLAMAQNMAGFSRSEVQHAVWDLQSPLLENADLITALRRVAHDISAGDSPRVVFEVSGNIFQLASTVEHHLLRMAQEAITNAVKHGAPKTIFLTLQYSADAMTLTVRDDGSGFVPEAASSQGGHFGLQGMRARANKIHAQLVLGSKPGDGTCIQITVSRDSRALQEEPAAVDEN